MANNSSKKKAKKKSLFNIPNALTVIRFILTFIIIWMIFSGFKILDIIYVFIFAAITDFLDGILARRLKQVTEFGRKADIIADRFLWVGTIIAFVIYHGSNGDFTTLQWAAIIMSMSREILSLPFAVYALFRRTKIPHAVYIAKVTTFLQGISIPLILLSIEYPITIYFALPVSIAILFTGSRSAFIYNREFVK